MLFRLFLISLLTLFLSSCSNNGKPSVEVLGTVKGIAVLDKDGKIVIKSSEATELKSGEGVVWYMYLRTNMKKVRYSEEVAMNGSSVWNFESKNKKSENKDNEDVKTLEYKISEDGSTATVFKEAQNLNGFIFGTWKMTDKDALGPVKIRVTVENEVHADFSWDLVKDKK